MGQHLNDNQFEILKELRQQGTNCQQIADRLGVHKRTIERNIKLTLPPSQRKRAKTNLGCGSDKYKIPREKIIIPILKQYNDISSKAIIEAVQLECPEANKWSLFPIIRVLRPHYSGNQERFFEQEKRAGEKLQLDSTVVPNINIKGSNQAVRIFHAYFPFSGHTFMTAYQGGESWEAIEHGVVSAFTKFNGVPDKIVTDSLGAVWVNQPKVKKYVTERMAQLSSHYDFEATRINLKKPNENGSVEKAHDHRKNEIEDQLILRGSRNFDSFEEFEALVANVMAKHNQKTAHLFKFEQSFLKPLPIDHFESSKLTKVRVYNNGTFRNQRVTYSVPANVPAASYSAEIFQNRIELYNQQGIIATVPRGPEVPKNEHRYQLDYRHFLPSLRQKPRALQWYKYRNYMFPHQAFQSVHEFALKQMEPRSACQYTVELLTLAEQENNETAVAKVLEHYLHHHTLPTTEQIQQDLNQIKEHQLDISSGSTSESITQQSTTIATPEPEQTTTDAVNDEVKFPRIAELDQDGDTVELTTQVLTLLFEQFLTQIGVDVNSHTNNIQQFLVTIKNNPPKWAMQGGANA